MEAHTYSHKVATPRGGIQDTRMGGDWREKEREREHSVVALGDLARNSDQGSHHMTFGHVTTQSPLGSCSGSLAFALLLCVCVYMCTCVCVRVQG